MKINHGVNKNQHVLKLAELMQAYEVEKGWWQDKTSLEETQSTSLASTSEFVLWKFSCVQTKFRLVCQLVERDDTYTDAKILN